MTNLSVNELNTGLRAPLCGGPWVIYSLTLLPIRLVIQGTHTPNQCNLASPLYLPVHGRKPENIEEPAENFHMGCFHTSQPDVRASSWETKVLAREWNASLTDWNKNGIWKWMCSRHHGSLRKKQVLLVGNQILVSRTLIFDVRMLAMLGVNYSSFSSPVDQYCISKELVQTAWCHDWQVQVPGAPPTERCRGHVRPDEKKTFVGMLMSASCLHWQR